MRLGGRGLRVEGRHVHLLLVSPRRVAPRHVLDAERRAEVVVVLRRPGPRHPDLEVPLLKGFKSKTKYRVTHLLANLGWVDFDFGCSTLCLVLLGLMGSWQNWLSSWARW